MESQSEKMRSRLVKVSDEKGMDVHGLVSQEIMVGAVSTGIVSGRSKL
jgi:hypothetical protein